jgi:putative serine protease PepD
MRPGVPWREESFLFTTVLGLLQRVATGRYVLIDVAMPSFLRPSLLTAFVLLIFLSGCQAQVNAPQPAAPASSSRPGAGSTIPVNPAPPPAGGTALDAVKVNQILGPAVGEVIVNTGRNPALGSGFVIAHNGSESMMLTNNHVVAGAQKVTVVMPDGKHFTAQVQGTDSLEDIAVLRIPDNSLPLAQFGDSTKVQVGQPVVAIGNPEGQAGSVTEGIISAVHRTLQSVGGGAGTPTESLPDVLQTDAPINPGNSGGPLADAQGLVIGVNTAGETQANGIGYAIPSLVAKRIAEALMAGKTPGHPYLGVCYRDLQAALLSGQSVDGYGIVVQKALPGTPADKAGLKAGDVVEKVDNVDLNNGNTLGGVLQLHNPGDTVPFAVQRGGGTTTLQVTLGDRPSTPSAC